MTSVFVTSGFGALTESRKQALSSNLGPHMGVKLNASHDLPVLPDR